MNHLPKEVIKELKRFEKGKAKALQLAKYYRDNGEKEVATQFMEQYKAIERAYRVLRSEYDVLYFAYE